jgi:hypothetical protein
LICKAVLSSFAPATAALHQAIAAAAIHIVLETQHPSSHQQKVLNVLSTAKVITSA